MSQHYFTKMLKSYFFPSNKKLMIKVTNLLLFKSFTTKCLEIALFVFNLIKIIILSCYIVLWNHWNCLSNIVLSLLDKIENPED